MYSYPPYISPLAHYSRSPQKEVIARAQNAKKKGKKIVIASGVFDLLHSAHTEYLKNAAKQGDFLVVLVESDERTRQMKGESRPIWDQEKRMGEVKKLSCVDEVLLLPVEFTNPLRYEEIVILLAPDVYAASSNSIALHHKEKMMKKYGGELRVVLQEIPGISTTKLLRKQGV